MIIYLIKLIEKGLIMKLEKITFYYIEVLCTLY